MTQTPNSPAADDLPPASPPPLIRASVWTQIYRILSHENDNEVEAFAIWVAEARMMRTRNYLGELVPRFTEDQLTLETFHVEAAAYFNLHSIAPEFPAAPRSNLSPPILLRSGSNPS